MEQKVNFEYDRLFLSKKRYCFLIGGRSAGRSYSASQYASSRLRDTDNYFRCAIMRFVLGDIRNSIFQEILDRLNENEIDDVHVREHNLTFACGGNKISGIGFRKSRSEQKSKLKSLAGFTDVIIEEADEVSEEDFTQLDDSIRTTKGNIRLILLLNSPPKNHWIVKRFFNLVPPEESEAKDLGFFKLQLKDIYKNNADFIFTDFTCNLENINETTIENFKLYQKTKPDHYWNMIRGYVTDGKRGRIFKNWQPTTNEVYDSLPFQEVFGLDFGFTNDPTALIGTKRHNKKLWAREYLFETGLTNTLISKRMDEIGIPRTALIYADSAEPKSIQELRDLGWDVVAAEKGADSVNAGIDMLLDYEVFYTEQSTNVANESQEYCWALDKEKNPTNKPIDAFNHGMDAIRYAIWTDSHAPFIGFV